MTQTHEPIPIDSKRGAALCGGGSAPLPETTAFLAERPNDHRSGRLYRLVTRWNLRRARRLTARAERATLAAARTGAALRSIAEVERDDALRRLAEAHALLRQWSRWAHPSEGNLR